MPRGRSAIAAPETHPHCPGLSGERPPLCYSVPRTFFKARRVSWTGHLTASSEVRGQLTAYLWPLLTSRRAVDTEDERDGAAPCFARQADAGVGPRDHPGGVARQSGDELEVGRLPSGRLCPGSTRRALPAADSAGRAERGGLERVPRTEVHPEQGAPSRSSRREAREERLSRGADLLGAPRQTVTGTGVPLGNDPRATSAPRRAHPRTVRRRTRTRHRPYGRERPDRG